MGLHLCDSCSAVCNHHREPNEIIVNCGAYKSLMTNADRIRAMSDEELAEFVKDCERAGYNDEHVTPEQSDGYHMDVLDWLSQPVEEARVWRRG